MFFVNHESAQQLTGDFDQHSENGVFKATFGGTFGPLISFGDVAEPGLSEEFLLKDIGIVGSGAGGCDSSYHLMYVPQPNLAVGDSRDDGTSRHYLRCWYGRGRRRPYRTPQCGGSESTRQVAFSRAIRTLESAEILEGNRYIFRPVAERIDRNTIELVPVEGTFSFGEVADPGLSELLLLDDLSIVGLANFHGDRFGEAGPLKDTRLVYLPAQNPTPLQAGDADQDLDFDQLDLVRVLEARKYLTGRLATWGEGDWNAAPGGSPGKSTRG